MAHIACICPPQAGHYNPMSVIADALTRRGHRATFINVADLSDTVHADGHDFEAVGAIDHPSGWLAGAKHRSGRVRGLFGSSEAIKDAAGLTTMFCRELPSLLRSLSVDLILVDQIEPAGGMVAYHLGLPFVSVAAGLPWNWEPAIPPPGIGWAYDTKRWHRQRNIVAAFVIKKLLAPIDRAIEAFATPWRLGRPHGLEHYMSGLAQVSQLVPSLDFPREALIGCFHYCGPFRRQGCTTADLDAPERSGRAFASLGSLQGHRFDLFQAIAAACAANRLDLTISHGGLLTPREIDALSRLADVRGLVAQQPLLASMELAVLHGGLNTVLDALAQGVPMVIIPLAYEQGAIAARVSRSGAGLVCNAGTIGRRNLARTIRSVRADKSFAKAATRLREDIRSAGGAEQAAEIVERLLRTGQPVLSTPPLRVDELMAGPLARSCSSAADSRLEQHRDAPRP